MDEEVDTPEDPRREFAEECRSARELHDPAPLTQAHLAKLLRTSKSTISRVETCHGAIPPDIPPRLDEVFATDGKFKRLYEEAVAASYPTLYRRRMAMERAAVAIREWSPTLVPGLFHTADYARCLFKGGFPRASTKETVAFVSDRLARKAVLEGGMAPDVRLVLCESVLYRRFCPPDVMRRQLKALLDAGSRPTVRVQILPLDAPGHLFSDWPVSLITSPDHTVSVCVENYRTAGIVDDPDSVRTALRTYDELTGDALSARESARLIAEQMEKLT
ncbi:helix-turn-helix domain-containing protein [Streptomyces paromomycinus]|uniref:Transcriptional regulator n=1 Tax=Streptomyces paromomycinus TaxID=92743 RepID=A0A401W787_STREY|nr:Scr1 family TA system antitoxin-like transcriptional regulator [Streptomyces paromomycinus]GCD45208.1 transcriptional regulator [Streptomyces paromomycinus]